MIVLTDYKSICKIVHYNILNITSIDRANHRLTNTSVYLSVYQLDIYYMPSYLNFVPNIFSYLRTLGNDIARKDDIKPILNVF